MEETRLLTEPEHGYRDFPPVQSKSREIAIRLTCFGMFVSGTLMLLLACLQQPSDQECAAQLSKWSPALEAVEYETREWDSAFSKTSEYIGSPTAELEERWHSLENVPVVVVPSARVASLNRNTSTSFVRTETPAPEGYIAGLEIFHHLHCLNVLRQYAWQDRYPEGLVPSLLQYNSAAVASKHVDHCIETLRQALMCNADVTPYLWYEGEQGQPAREDFQAAHKCMRFDRIVEWVMRNGVNVPPGAISGR